MPLDRSSQYPGPPGARKPKFAGGDLIGRPRYEDAGGDANHRTCGCACARFGFQFNFDYHVTLLSILWALGWAMIVLSALVHAPVALSAALGLAMIAGHNAFDSIQSSNPIWSILHRLNFVLKTPQYSVFVG